MNKMITLSLIITLLVVFSACAMAQETVTQQPAKAGTAAELDLYRIAHYWCAEGRTNRQLRLEDWQLQC